MTRGYASDRSPRLRDRQAEHRHVTPRLRRRQEQVAEEEEEEY
jgi:hypothetical protein